VGAGLHFFVDILLLTFFRIKVSIKAVDPKTDSFFQNGYFVLSSFSIISKNMPCLIGI
jgi:hypothetical protein